MTLSIVKNNLSNAGKYPWRLYTNKTLRIPTFGGEEILVPANSLGAYIDDNSSIEFHKDSTVWVNNSIKLIDSVVKFINDEDQFNYIGATPQVATYSDKISLIECEIEDSNIYTCLSSKIEQTMLTRSNIYGSFTSYNNRIKDSTIKSSIIATSASEFCIYNSGLTRTYIDCQSAALLSRVYLIDGHVKDPSHIITASIGTVSIVGYISKTLLTDTFIPIVEYCFGNCKSAGDTSDISLDTALGDTAYFQYLLRIVGIKDISFIPQKLIRMGIDIKKQLEYIIQSGGLK